METGRQFFIPDECGPQMPAKMCEYLQRVDNEFSGFTTTSLQLRRSRLVFCLLSSHPVDEMNNNLRYRWWITCVTMNKWWSSLLRLIFVQWFACSGRLSPRGLGPGIEALMTPSMITMCWMWSWRTRRSHIVLSSCRDNAKIQQSCYLIYGGYLNKITCVNRGSMFCQKKSRSAENQQGLTERLGWQSRLWF